MAIDSAPPEGVLVVPLSQIRVFFPILSNPANRHRAVGFTPEQFHYAFTNTLSGRSRTRSTSATTSPRRAASSGAASWPTSPRATRTSYVNFANDDRAPLLFIAGGEDNIMPPR